MTSPIPASGNDDADPSTPATDVVRDADPTEQQDEAPEGENNLPDRDSSDPHTPDD